MLCRQLDVQINEVNDPTGLKDGGDRPFRKEKDATKGIIRRRETRLEVKTICNVYVCA